MKQDIEAKMKDKTSVDWVGFGGLYFFHSLEGHLHVLLLEQGVYLQKRPIDVINPTAAHGIVPKAQNYAPPKIILSTKHSPLFANHNLKMQLALSQRADTAICLNKCNIHWILP